jgi:hypothetical protein
MMKSKVKTTKDNFNKGGPEDSKDALDSGGKPKKSDANNDLMLRLAMGKKVTVGMFYL